MTNFQKIKYLPRVLSLLEKRIILILFLIILGSASWLLYGVYDRHREFVAEYGDNYTEGLVGQPQYINPILAPASDADSDLSKLVFSSLLKYNEKQELIPDLAERYEITPDQKNYTFYLRKDVRWHDGVEFTADDIIYTVQVVKNSEYQSPLMLNFKDISVEKIDQYTVKFTLTKEAFAPFLFESTTFGILPKHVWEKISPKSVPLSEYNLKPTGTGPFKFKEYKKDKKTGEILSYTLERNEKFYNKKPYIAGIEFKFYSDEDLLISALNKKETQGVAYIPPTEKNKIKKEKSINFYTPQLSRYYAVFINYAKNENLESKETRQALAYAVDRKRILNEALLDYAKTINSPILPNLFGYNPKVKKYTYDEKKAKEIIEKAGWVNDKKLEITLTYPNEEEFPKVAEIIKENWEKIGVVVHMKAANPSEMQSEIIKPRNYEVLLFGQLQTRDPDPYAYWHSSERGTGLNLTSFKDKTADKLLEDARKSKTDDERKKKYLHFQNIIADEVPAIFLYSPQYLYGVNKKVRGVQLEYIITPSDRFAGVENWYINVKRKLK